MRRTAAVIFLLYAGCAGAYAQRVQATCPVGLFAERQSALAMLSASEAASRGPSQGLHVTLERADGLAIVSVEATLYGVSQDPRVVPAVDTAKGEVSKSFRLERRAGEESLASFDVWMNRVGALRWVEVTSITYADGSSWRAATGSVCRAVPTLVMLVAGR